MNGSCFGFPAFTKYHSAAVGVLFTRTIGFPPSTSCCNLRAIKQFVNILKDSKTLTATMLYYGVQVLSSMIISPAITMEEIPPAATPLWLISHFESQLRDPRSMTQGGPPQLLTIHPTESSRRAALNHLAKSGLDDGPIDRTAHHTLDSLLSSLHAELRQPRLIPSSGPFSILLHIECKKAARHLAFPLMHSLPDQHWGRGKTRDLSSLNSALKEESLSLLVSPDLLSFRKLIHNLSSKLGGVHPDEQLATIVELLEELPTEKVPFGLSKVDGILMLNHPPTLTPMRQRLVNALSRFRPLHVLSHSGSHRLGLHGFVPNDISPIRKAEELPYWLPEHSPWHPSADELNTEDKPLRLLVPKIERSIEATHALLNAALNAKHPPQSILIIDPSAESNHEIWSSMLDSFGFCLARNSTPLCESPSVHWLSALISLPHYEDAWSLSQLRSFAVQNTLQFETDWLSSEQHPSIPELRPVPDVDVLEEVSRGFHLLGGQGALFRWLHALARKPLANAYQDEEDLGLRHEATQWWLLSLANRLKPLMTSFDAKLFEDPLLSLGCFSGKELPLPKPDENGDQWLRQFGSLLKWDLLTNNLDGDVNKILSGLQNLFEGHSSLRKSQRMLGHSSPKGGQKWVDELLILVDGLTISGSRAADAMLRLLTPTEALGCHADLVILTHLDSESWNTSPPTTPGLSENERSELGVLPPDNRLREARHAWNHLLRCGNEIIVLDAGEDESSQPSTPLSEWLADSEWDTTLPPRIPSFISDSEVYRLDGDETSCWGLAFIEEEGVFPVARPSDVSATGDGVYELLVTGSHQRDIRQRSGINLHRGRNPLQAPLNPSAVTISLDANLIEDRLSRQPRVGSKEEPYLPNSRIGEIMTIDNLRMQLQSNELKVTSPRMSDSWPTIGLKIPPRSRALTIDPRPLTPNPTSLDDHDRRHGFLDGPSRVTKVWSPSRLTQWLSCPRKGWLSNRLKVEGEDEEDDDVDARTRGLLIHEVWAQFICECLNMNEGVERNKLVPLSLATAGINEEDLRLRLLQIVDEKAPWLRRSDAIATVRRLDLVGLDLKSYEDALDDDLPILSGRFSRFLQSELTLSASAILAIEWPLTNNKGKPGILLELPEKGENVLSGICLRGTIDRVELIPHPNNDGTFVDDGGSKEICPLDIDKGEKWAPQRLVVIRDLKSLEGPKKGDAGKRHQRELLEGIQLALYARAWEVEHPGDRVVGVGISEIGEDSCLYIEADPDYHGYLASLDIGEIACNTESLFRRPDESSESPQSNSFRAWMRHRLTSALRIGHISEEGSVIPTPSEINCTYCSVKQVCGLAPIVGGDNKWS